MRNIVLDCKDRMDRRIVLLTSGAMFILEDDTPIPEPYVVLDASMVASLINTMLDILRIK